MGHAKRKCCMCNMCNLGNLGNLGNLPGQLFDFKVTTKTTGTYFG